MLVIVNYIEIGLCIIVHDLRLCESREASIDTISGVPSIGKVAQHHVMVW